MENITDKEFVKYKTTLSKLEILTNLIFGLEMRLNEKIQSNSNDGLFMLEYQMKNSKEILDGHEKSLNELFHILSQKIDTKMVEALGQFIRIRKRNICLKKALVRELYFIHVKLDIINLL